MAKTMADSKKSFGLVQLIFQRSRGKDFSATNRLKVWVFNQSSKTRNYTESFTTDFAIQPFGLCFITFRQSRNSIMIHLTRTSKSIELLLIAFLQQFRKTIQYAFKTTSSCYCL